MDDIQFLLDFISRNDHLAHTQPFTPLPPQLLFARNAYRLKN